jgi:hypothetical protein
MPTLPWDDESLPLLDHGIFDRTVAIDAREETPFEHAKYFIACGMAFPVIGMNRMVVMEVGDPERAIVSFAPIRA